MSGEGGSLQNTSAHREIRFAGRLPRFVGGPAMAARRFRWRTRRTRRSEMIAQFVDRHPQRACDDAQMAQLFRGDVAEILPFGVSHGTTAVAWIVVSCFGIVNVVMAAFGSAKSWGVDPQCAGPLESHAEKCGMVAAIGTTAPALYDPAPEPLMTVRAYFGANGQIANAGIAMARKSNTNSTRRIDPPRSSIPKDHHEPECIS